MTEQVAHTPGPWTHYRRAHPGIHSVHDERGTIIAEVIRLDSSRFAEAEANARLIAAAPELLACLKEALELIQEDIDNRDGRDNFGMCCGRCDGAIPVEHSFGCRAKAAISKAETGS